MEQGHSSSSLSYWRRSWRRRVGRLRQMDVAELRHRLARAIRRRLGCIPSWLRSPNLSDKALARAFDDQFSHLRGFAAYGRRWDQQQCRARLKRYYEEQLGRRLYGSSWSRRGLAEAFATWADKADKEDVVRQADDICRHRLPLLGFGQVHAGPTINWHRDYVRGIVWPSRYWGRVSIEPADGWDVKTVWELNLHQHFVTLSMAYLLSEQDRYAYEFTEQIESWLAQNPAGIGVNWTESVEIGIRLISWVWTIALLLSSSCLSPRLFGEILKSIVLQARHVRRNLSIYTSPNTHLIGEGVALFILGIVFREFKEADAWRRIGRSILESEILRQVGNDGVYLECSLYYHCYTVEFYLITLILAEHNGIALDPIIGDRLQRMVEALMWIIRPDGTVPMLGDGDGGRALRLNRRNYREAQDLLCMAAILFGRPDFKAAAGRFRPEALWLGPQALDRFQQLPDGSKLYGWRYFPDASLCIDRRLWRGDERYLLFDCADLGMLQGGHGHAGCLGIEVFAHGKSLLVDPGTYVYNGAPAWRNYFRSTRAHNTVVVDDADQAEVWNTFQWETRFRARVHRQLGTRDYSLAEADHDGYARLPEPVKHQRAVLSIAGEYWLCLDAFLGVGIHKFDFLFHFPPNTVVRPLSGLDSIAVVDSSAGVYIFPLGFEGMQSRVVAGEKDPIQGWYSDDYGRKEPAPVLIFSERCGVPTTRGFMLFPFIAGELPDLVVESQQSAEGLAATFHQGARTDLLYYALRRPGTFCDIGVEFVGDLLHLRLTEEGLPSHFLICGARYLQWQGMTLVEADGLVDWVSVVNNGQCLWVESGSFANARVFIPKLRQPVICYVNGVEMGKVSGAGSHITLHTGVPPRVELGG